MPFEIAGRRIGADQPLYVIAELGLNHGGSLERALALVDAAADAGASAVKVQTFRAADLVAPDGPPPAHVPEPSLLEFFRRFELDEAAHHRLAAHARRRGLALLATAFSRDAVAMLERVGVDAYKIASGDITFHGLIECCARTGKPLVLSTGMASVEEVAAAVAAARRAGARELAILHCVSAYPVPEGSENLRAIATLAATFRTDVGLSDHGATTAALTVAVALGAAVYERHLTLPGDDGVDRAVSSLPDELADAIRLAARTRAALGHGRKECLPVEAGNVRASRRGLHAATTRHPGDIVRPEDIVVLRPADGLSPAHERELIGATVTRRVDAGCTYQPCDLHREIAHHAAD